VIVETRNRRFLSEINVIPLVDVVLVLLVIFMVTAPMLHRGMDIKLPASSTNTIAPEERMVVTIERNHKLYLDKEAVSVVGLGERLQEAKQRNPDISVYLRADQSIPYGRVVQVMDEVKVAGIEKLGMVTVPSDQQLAEEQVVE